MKFTFVDKIMKLFKEKPEVKSSSDKWPDAKNIYGLANIKNMLVEIHQKLILLFMI